MTRTTLDIDTTILSETKEIARQRGETLGKVVSELLAQALAVQASRAKPAFRWPSQSLGARIPFEDKAALWAALDGRE